MTTKPNTVHQSDRSQLLWSPSTLASWHWAGPSLSPPWDTLHGAGVRGHLSWQLKTPTWLLVLGIRAFSATLIFSWFVEPPAWRCWCVGLAGLLGLCCGIPMWDFPPQHKLCEGCRSVRADVGWFCWDWCSWEMPVQWIQASELLCFGQGVAQWWLPRLRPEGAALPRSSRNRIVRNGEMGLSLPISHKSKLGEHNQLCGKHQDVIPGWQSLPWPSQLPVHGGVTALFHLDTGCFWSAFGALLRTMSHKKVAQYPLRVHGAQTGLSRKEHQKIPAGKRQSRPCMCCEFSTPFSSAALSRTERCLCPFHWLTGHTGLMVGKWGSQLCR